MDVPFTDQRMETQSINLSSTGRHIIYTPNGRNSSRAIICRCISLVPSQILSTRASRQNRSIGRSSIKPIPPKICTASSVTRPSISGA